MTHYGGQKNVGTFREDLFLFNTKSLITLKANRSLRGKLMKCRTMDISKNGSKHPLMSTERSKFYGIN